MTRRRGTRETAELPEPEILPMMNVLFMLVMVLMGMSAFLPIGVITVQAPQFGNASAETSETKKGPELNLTVMILKSGINLSVAGKILKSANGPLFPKVLKNGQSVYDFAALGAKIEEIKSKYPDETRAMIMADPDIIYDDITHTMDTIRLSSKGLLMFNEIAFVPGVIQ